MILPFALLVLMLGSGLLPGKDYRFSLNDREFDPRILPVVGTRKGDYKPGDIAVSYTHLTLPTKRIE